MTERLAILADIHANIQALRAALDHADRLGCASIYCLGDMVGYGARPRECLDLLRERDATCLCGNHEALVLDPGCSGAYNTNAIAGADLARRELTTDDIEYLRTLPAEIRLGESTLLVHGSPWDRDAYLLTGAALQRARRELEARSLRLCFFGHTHLPVFGGDRDVVPVAGLRATVDPQCVTLVNPGSVGQPRDRNPAAHFLWWEAASGRVGFEQIAYDAEAARDDILAAGLPTHLGDRLLTGR